MTPHFVLTLAHISLSYWQLIPNCLFHIAFGSFTGITNPICEKLNYFLSTPPLLSISATTSQILQLLVQLNIGSHPWNFLKFPLYTVQSSSKCWWCSLKNAYVHFPVSMSKSLPAFLKCLMCFLLHITTILLPFNNSFSVRENALLSGMSLSLNFLNTFQVSHSPSLLWFRVYIK